MAWNNSNAVRANEMASVTLPRDRRLSAMLSRALASEPVKKSVSNQSRRLRMESETACHVVGDGEPRRSGFDLFETSNQELP